MSAFLPSLFLVALGLCAITSALPAGKSNRDGLFNFAIQPNTAENLARLASGRHPPNVEELSGKFEGDLVLNAEQQMLVDGRLRNGLLDEAYRWPAKTVPVLLTEGHFDAAQTAHIYKALRTIESLSCVRFVNYTTEESYVRMTSDDDGCYSNVGFLNDGEQTLNLESYPVEQGCLRLGTIMHEFLHTLGFYHMQSATERDDFVRIMWQHLTPGTENNFNKYDADRITNFGHLYDVTSIMHYSAYGFSRDGYATIVPNNITLINVMGQRVGMSVADVARLNTMYKCDA